MVDWILKHNQKVIVPFWVAELSIDAQELPEQTSSEMIEICPMSLHHRYYFAKLLSSSHYISHDEKLDIFQTVYQGYGHSTNLYRKISHKKVPTQENKVGLWNQISSIKGNYPFEEYRLLTDAFMSGARISVPGNPEVPDTYSLCEPHLNEYFDVLLTMVKSGFSKQK